MSLQVSWSVLVATMVYLLATGQAQQYVNEFDGQATFTCSGGQYMDHIESYHQDNQEDRRWSYGCRGYGATVGCDWSGFANDFNQLLTFMCPRDSVVTGMDSYHSNHHEDRRFRFRCCTISGKRTHNCDFTSLVNDWDGRMSWTVTSGRIIKGAVSFHDDYYGDRRWKFIVCDLD